MKILKIIVWDQLNYDKVINMIQLSFKFNHYIDVVIGDDDNNDINTMKIYVGYNSTTLHKPELMDLLDITDNQINNNCYWSFGYDEDRVLFGKYLKKYVKELSVRFFDQSIQYEVIDYVFSDSIHCVEGEI
jgi:hypothetical protein